MRYKKDLNINEDHTSLCKLLPTIHLSLTYGLSSLWLVLSPTECTAQLPVYYCLYTYVYTTLVILQSFLKSPSKSALLTTMKESVSVLNLKRQLKLLPLLVRHFLGGTLWLLSVDLRTYTVTSYVATYRVQMRI